MNTAWQAAENFISRNEIIAGIEEYGHGIIHNTYRVRLAESSKTFILQRLNPHVFQNPEAIMHNLAAVCEHIKGKRKLAGGGMIGGNWQDLQYIKTRDDRLFFIDTAGGFWRALVFISGAHPVEQVTCCNEAREVGRALGIFHTLVSDLKPECLLDTLPGFHNIEQYLEKYGAGPVNGKKMVAKEAYCRRFVEERRSWAPVLENARRQKKLPVRIIHGDPKCNNILIGNRTGQAVSIIDLDTVMPGLVHYDIGDCLRSCCNIVFEESGDLSAVSFDSRYCQALLSGYAGVAGKFLTGPEFDYLYDAIRLLPFELGLRFYTDHLGGNVYFKVSRQDQNLHRAAVQFKLVESIERQADRLNTIIDECRHSMQIN